MGKSILLLFEYLFKVTFFYLYVNWNNFFCNLIAFKLGEEEKRRFLKETLLLHAEEKKRLKERMEKVSWVLTWLCFSMVSLVGILFAERLFFFLQCYYISFYCFSSILKKYDVLKCWFKFQWAKSNKLYFHNIVLWTNRLVIDLLWFTVWKISWDFNISEVWSFYSMMQKGNYKKVKLKISNSGAKIF